MEEEASKDKEDENSSGGEAEDSSEEEEDRMSQINYTTIPGHSFRSASSCVAKARGSSWMTSCLGDLGGPKAVRQDHFRSPR